MLCSLSVAFLALWMTSFMLFVCASSSRVGNWSGASPLVSMGWASVLMWSTLEGEEVAAAMVLEDSYRRRRYMYGDDEERNRGGEAGDYIADLLRNNKIGG